MSDRNRMIAVEGRISVALNQGLIKCTKQAIVQPPVRRKRTEVLRAPEWMWAIALVLQSPISLFFKVWKLWHCNVSAAIYRAGEAYKQWISVLMYGYKKTNHRKNHE